MRVGIFVAAALLGSLPSAVAQSGRSAAAPDIRGVYQAIVDGVVIAGGRKNEGSPADLSLLPAAAQKMKAVNLKEDPAKMCQPVGPFRMMARPQTKIELIPANGMIVMLFEDLSRGLMRTIYLTRPHRPGVEPNWMGDSIGRWDGDALVVDTIGFNDQTWLNDHGAQHSDALHLVERIRPVLSGQYLEYKVTAEDPKALAKPFTYTRFYEKLKTEVHEDSCEDEP